MHLLKKALSSLTLVALFLTITVGHIPHVPLISDKSAHAADFTQNCAGGDATITQGTDFNSGDNVTVGGSGTCTITLNGDATMGTLTVVASATFLMSGAEANVSTASIAGTITHKAAQGSVGLSASNYIDIQSGGSINADGKGCPASQGPNVSGDGSCTSQGSGAHRGGNGGEGADGSGSGGSGGGHGGYGGEQTGGFGSGGGLYDNPMAPGIMGSGGGTEGGNAGGAGGGVIVVNTTGTLNLVGTISAKGADGTTNGGGGSGGSIFIMANQLTGVASGTSIDASGGDSGTDGGGGGGGMIAFYFTQESSFSQAGSLVHSYTTNNGGSSSESNNVGKKGTTFFVHDPNSDSSEWTTSYTASAIDDDSVVIKDGFHFNRDSSGAISLDISSLEIANAESLHTDDNVTALTLNMDSSNSTFATEQYTNSTLTCGSSVTSVSLTADTTGALYNAGGTCMNAHYKFDGGTYVAGTTWRPGTAAVGQDPLSVGSAEVDVAYGLGEIVFGGTILTLGLANSIDIASTTATDSFTFDSATLGNVTSATTDSVINLSTTGTLTLKNSSVLTGSFVNDSITRLDVQDQFSGFTGNVFITSLTGHSTISGTINANGIGCSSSQGPDANGNCAQNGTSPGSNTTHGEGGDHASGPGGGGYGGVGGSSTVSGGGIYGSTTMPFSLGSGGGHADNGGWGGGVIYIASSASILVGTNATISANGNDPFTGPAGGGSGGSVFINAAGDLYGNGTITANGSNGSSGGGGGGGRIALVYNATSGSAVSNATASAGTGGSGAMPGTVYTNATAPSNTAPTLSNLTATPLTDGSGGVQITFQIDDADDDTDIRVQVQKAASYEGASTAATLSETDANTTATYGDPGIDNAATYQIGTTSSFITAASGANTVTTIWNSSVDYTTANGISVGISVTPNDGTEDGTAAGTSMFTIDNVAPTISLNDLADTSSSSITITGTAESTASIFDSGGTQIATASTDGTFSFSQSLAVGANNLAYYATDSYGNASSAVSTTVTRSNNVTALAITPTSGTVTIGNQLTFTATATYEDESTAALNGASVSWIIDNATSGSISASGVLEALAVGTITVYATYTGDSDTITSNSAVISTAAQADGGGGGGGGGSSSGSSSSGSSDSSDGTTSDGSDASESGADGNSAGTTSGSETDSTGEADASTDETIDAAGTDSTGAGADTTEQPIVVIEATPIPKFVPPAATIADVAVEAPINAADDLSGEYGTEVFDGTAGEYGTEVFNEGDEIAYGTEVFSGEGPESTPSPFAVEVATPAPVVALAPSEPEPILATLGIVDEEPAEGSAAQEVKTVPVRATVITGGGYINTITDADEFVEKDTDNDGVSDALETMLGSNPEDNEDAPVDTNDNGVADAWEQTYEVVVDDPSEVVNDSGMSIGLKAEYGLNPTTDDSDGDGISDIDEIEIYKTNPLRETKIEETLAQTPVKLNVKKNAKITPKKNTFTGTTVAGSTVFVYLLQSDGSRTLLSESVADKNHKFVANTAGLPAGKHKLVVQSLVEKTKAEELRKIKQQTEQRDAGTLSSFSKDGVSIAVEKDTVTITGLTDEVTLTKNGQSVSFDQDFNEDGSVVISKRQFARGMYLVAANDVAVPFSVAPSIASFRSTNTLLASSLSAEAITENIEIFESDPIEIEVDPGLTVTEPLPEKFATVELTNEHLIKGLRVTVENDQPVIEGTLINAKPNQKVKVVANWKSLLLTSALIADTNKGDFKIFAPKPLEEGSHEVFLHAENTQAGERSSNVNLKFTIETPRAKGNFLVMSVVGGVVFVGFIIFLIAIVRRKGGGSGTPAPVA